MISVNFTEFRKRLALWYDRANNDRAPILVTRQGHEPVVLIAQSEYDSMVETLYLKSSPKNVTRLDEAVAQLNAGQGIEHELR
jgi:antitoxin YefM